MKTSNTTLDEIPDASDSRLRIYVHAHAATSASGQTPINPPCAIITRDDALTSMGRASANPTQVQTIGINFMIDSIDREGVNVSLLAILIVQQ